MYWLFHKIPDQNRSSSQGILEQSVNLVKKRCVVLGGGEW